MICCAPSRGFCRGRLAGAPKPWNAGGRSSSWLPAKPTRWPRWSACWTTPTWLCVSRRPIPWSPSIGLRAMDRAWPASSASSLIWPRTRALGPATGPAWLRSKRASWATKRPRCAPGPLQFAMGHPIPTWAGCSTTTNVSRWRPEMRTQSRSSISIARWSLTFSPRRRACACSGLSPSTPWVSATCRWPLTTTAALPSGGRTTTRPWRPWNEFTASRRIWARSTKSFCGGRTWPTRPGRKWFCGARPAAWRSAWQGKKRPSSPGSGSGRCCPAMRTRWRRWMLSTLSCAAGMTW